MAKSMHFVSCSHFIQFRMLYYENKDTSGITANMYIPWHIIQTIKLHLPFIFQYCIAVIRSDTLRPACMLRDSMHKSLENRNSSNQVLLVRPCNYVSTRSRSEFIQLLQWRGGILLLLNKQVTGHWVFVGVSCLCEKEINHACFEVANWEDLVSLQNKYNWCLINALDIVFGHSAYFSEINSHHVEQSALSTRRWFVFGIFFLIQERTNLW